MLSVFSRGVMGRGIFRVLGLSELQEAKNTIQERERDWSPRNPGGGQGRGNYGDTFYMRPKGEEVYEWR